MKGQNRLELFLFQGIDFLKDNPRIADTAGVKSMKYKLLCIIGIV